MRVHSLGLTFSPNGSHAYVTDTGVNKVVLGWNFSEPASMYAIVADKPELNSS